MAPLSRANDERPPSADRLPTLTEVVHIGVAVPAADATLHAPPPDAMPAPGDAPHRVQDDALVQQVLDALQPQIDRLIADGLRQVLAPLLARAADDLVADCRSRLVPALQTALTDAVAQSLHRQRQG